MEAFIHHYARQAGIKQKQIGGSKNVGSGFYAGCMTPDLIKRNVPPVWVLEVRTPGIAGYGHGMPNKAKPDSCKLRWAFEVSPACDH